MAHPRIIGIIAGSGVYPETFIEAARRNSPGVKLVVAAFHGETKPELGEKADAIEWFRVAQLGRMIKFFRREGVTEGALKLQRAGLISYARGRIKVLDRPGLERRTCECYSGVKKEYDRLGLSDEYTEIMGVRIPYLVIPVRPGRNLAIIIEVAARNFSLKKMGYSAAKELDRRLNAMMNLSDEV